MKMMLINNINNLKDEARTISKLVIYLVKLLQGVEVNKIEFNNYGFVCGRRFMLVYNNSSSLESKKLILTFYTSKISSTNQK